MTKQEITKVVLKAVDDILCLAEYPLDANLYTELGMDSLDHVEFIMKVEKELNIYIPDGVADGLVTLNQTIECLIELNQK